MLPHGPVEVQWGMNSGSYSNDDPVRLKDDGAFHRSITFCKLFISSSNSGERLVFFSNRIKSTRAPACFVCRPTTSCYLLIFQSSCFFLIDSRVRGV